MDYITLGVIIIVLIGCGLVGAIFWILTSQDEIGQFQNIRNRQGCEPIVFAWNGVVSEWDCSNG